VVELRDREPGVGARSAHHVSRVRRSRAAARSGRSCASSSSRRRAGVSIGRVRRSREGQHAPQLLRHRTRLHRLHRRPESAQAGPVSAGLADPGAQIRRRSGSRVPTSSSSCRGNLRDEVDRAARVRAATGAAASPPRSPGNPDLPVIRRPKARPSTPADLARRDAGDDRSVSHGARGRRRFAPPTTAFPLPMVTPFSTTTFCAIHTKSPISTGSATSACRARCRSGSLPWSWSRIATFEPIRTLFADDDRLRRRHAEVPLDLQRRRRCADGPASAVRLDAHRFEARMCTDRDITRRSRCGPAR